MYIDYVESRWFKAIFFFPLLIFVLQREIQLALSGDQDKNKKMPPSPKNRNCIRMMKAEKHLEWKEALRIQSIPHQTWTCYGNGACGYSLNSDKLQYVSSSIIIPERSMKRQGKASQRKFVYVHRTKICRGNNHILKWVLRMLKLSEANEIFLQVALNLFYTSITASEFP